MEGSNTKTFRWVSLIYIVNCELLDENLPVIKIDPRNSNLEINDAIHWKGHICEENSSGVVPVFNLIRVQRVKKVNQMREEYGQGSEN